MRIFETLAVMALLTLSAAADQTWRTTLTSPAHGSHPRLVPTAIEMRLSWKNTINAGKLSIEFGVPKTGKANAMVIRSSASSQGAAAALYPFKSDYWSELDARTLRPRFFQASEWDGEESATTTIRHFSGRVECRETTTVIKSGKATVKDQTFHFTPVFDLFSAMLHVRSQKLAAGERMALVIQPLKSPYLLEVRSHGSEHLSGRKAIRLSLNLRKINPNTFALKPYAKLKSSVTLWLSDDADRLPLEIRAPVFIGDVRATLVNSRRL